MSGLLAFSGLAEAKDVYYVSGYFGVPGHDAASFTVKDADGNSATYEDGDTVIIGKYATVTEAWVSDDAWLPPLIKIEKDFTFHSGVSGEVLSGITVEIAENCTLTLNKGNSANVIKVGTVIFEGDGTVDLSGAASVSDPLTLHAGTKFKLPENYTGGIVISDPENIDPADYPDYVIYVDASGKTQLMPKKDVVAYVDAIPYRALQSAFDAAKPLGTIVMSTWPTSNLPIEFKDTAQWQGTVTFSGTMPNGFAPANYGNASSTIEFKGVSGGYLSDTNLSFDGALKLTNDGATPAWTAQVGFSDVKYAFSFGSLTGSGDFVDNGGANQQYSFSDASTFAGNVTVLTKRFVIGSKGHDKISRIYVEKDAIANVAAGRKWDGQWAVRIDGTIIGSGTLASAKQKQIYFGYEPNVGAINDAKPTIDLSEGAPTVDSSCGVTFGSTLTLKNIQLGDTILKCSSKPTNLDTVTLKDASGATPSLWSLKFEDGAVKLSGGIKKLSGNESWTVDAATAADFPTPLILDLSSYQGEGGGKPVGETAHMVITFPEGMDANDYLSKIQVVYPTLHAAGSLSASGNKIFFTFGHLDLYWNAWRGTFWEAVFGGDVHGNKGLGRTDAGAEQAILAGDTVIFDKRHYQVDGKFAQQSPYWHYDENLYIKDEVNPGVKNDWDLKVLEGVTLKMGLRGAKTTGQNIIRDFKIYVDADSTLELGYWGNTHHYQGVIRPDVVFGGAGTITLGDDMGSSCRVEGNLGVKGGEVPTLDVCGKELVVKGGTIDVNLTGFGALSGSGTITTPMTLENATIDASTSPGFTFTDEVTIKGVLTAHVSSLPTGAARVPLLTASDVDFTKLSRVILVCDGQVSPLVYTLESDGTTLYAKIDNTNSVSFTASSETGYDWKTFFVVVRMSQPIAGVWARVSTTRPLPEDVSDGVTQKEWKVRTDADGVARILIGSPDELLDDGTYTWTATVDGLSGHVTENWTIGSSPVAQVDFFALYSMKEAVAAAGKSGTIKLLTNVFFAPPPGTYKINRDGHDIMVTNDMLWQDCSEGVKITAPQTVDHYTVFENEAPFVIEGEWLGYALPWKTQKRIQEALIDPTESENGLKPFEAFVLGILAATWSTEKLIARGVETGDPRTMLVDDGLKTKPSEKTGVVVTKTLVDAETKREVSATPIYNLLEMGTKAKLLKLNYAFSPDRGQGTAQGE